MIEHAPGAKPKAKSRAKSNCMSTLRSPFIPFLISVGILLFPFPSLRANSETSSAKDSSAPSATPKKIKIEKLPGAPNRDFNDATMAKIGELGRKVGRLQRQSFEANEAAARASEASQNFFFQLAENRIITAKRILRQAEIESEASRFDRQASELDKQVSALGATTQNVAKWKLSQSAAELRLKASENRARSQALSLEGAEFQLKNEKIAGQANAENVKAAKFRADSARFQSEIWSLEEEMKNLSVKTQNISGGGTR